MRYTLYLQNALGTKFYLAPRSSIKVEEGSDFETLATDDQACGLCTLTGKRTFKFTIHFVGNCSLASAWALYNALTGFFNDSCDVASDVILYRRVQDEDYLQYKVTKSSLNMTDVQNQYTRERILSIAMSLELTTWPPSGAVLVGS